MTKSSSKTQWVSTSIAAERLGVSKQFLLKYRGDLFKQRKHWKNINPHAFRPTYRWHVANCEKAMDGDELPNPKLCDS